MPESTLQDEFIDLVRERQMERALRLFREHRDEWAKETHTPVLLDAFARLLDREPMHLPVVSEWIERFGAIWGDGRAPERINYGKLSAQETTHLMLARAGREVPQGGFPLRDRGSPLC